MKTYYKKQNTVFKDVLITLLVILLIGSMCSGAFLLNMTTTTMNSKIDDVVETNSALTADVSAKNTIIASNEQEIQTLNSQNGEYLTLIAEIDNALTSTEDTVTVETLEQRKTAILAQIEANNQVIADKESEIARLQAEIEEMKSSAFYIDTDTINTSRDVWFNYFEDGVQVYTGNFLVNDYYTTFYDSQMYKILCSVDWYTGASISSSFNLTNGETTLFSSTSEQYWCNDKFTTVNLNVLRTDGVVFNYDDLDDLVAQGNLKYKIDFDFDYYVGEEYEDIKSNYPDEFDIQVGYNILKNFNITVYLSTED